MATWIGKVGGRIDRSIGQLPNNALYVVQKNAWMDEHAMMIWINTVIRPWAESAPDGICPFLLLDSYHCHHIDRVQRAIEELGVDVRHIPGGCTGLCQP